MMTFYFLVLVVGVMGLSDGASVKCLRGTGSAKCSDGHQKEDYKKEIHLCCNKKEIICPVIPILNNVNITMKSQELKCGEKKRSGQRRGQKFENYSCPIETHLYISALLSALPDEPGSRDWKTKMTDIFNGVPGVQKWLNKDKDFWSGLRRPQDWVEKAGDFLKKLSGSHDWLIKLKAAIKNSDPSCEKDDDSHDIDATTTDIADDDDDTFNNDDENNEDNTTADDDDGDDGDSKDVTNTTDDDDGDDGDSKEVTNTTDDDGRNKNITITAADGDDVGGNKNITITAADGDDDGGNKNIAITVADGDDVGDNKEFSTMHILFPCLALVVILVTCFFFLWLANRKHQRNLEIGGASDQVPPGKKMESISDSDLRNNELVYIKPSHNYEEILVPQEDSTEVLQNPLYIPYGNPSQEKQSGSEDEHPAEGQYSLLQFPGQQ